MGSRYRFQHLVVRTVDVGGLTPAELRRESDRLSILVNEQGQKLLTRLASSPSTCRVDTVELTVGDLGFADGATTAELFQRADQFGLDRKGLLEVEPDPKEHQLGPGLNRDQATELPGRVDPDHQGLVGIRLVLIREELKARAKLELWVVWVVIKFIKLHFTTPQYYP